MPSSIPIHRAGPTILDIPILSDQTAADFAIGISPRSCGSLEVMSLAELIRLLPMEVAMLIPFGGGIAAP